VVHAVGRAAEFIPVGSVAAVVSVEQPETEQTPATAGLDASSGMTTFTTLARTSPCLQAW
jgi:hypothetical protein